MHYMGLERTRESVQKVIPKPSAMPRVFLILTAVLSVIFFMDLFQMAVGDVRINLRRVDRCVAE